MDYKVKHLNRIAYLFLSAAITSALITIMDLSLRLGISTMSTVATWVVSSSFGWYLTYRYAKRLECNNLTISEIREGLYSGIRFKVVGRDIGKILSETNSRLGIVRRNFKLAGTNRVIEANTSNHLNEIIANVYEVRDYYILRLISEGYSQEEICLMFGLTRGEVSLICNAGVKNDLPN